MTGLCNGMFVCVCVMILTSCIMFDHHDDNEICPTKFFAFKLFKQVRMIFINKIIIMIMRLNSFRIFFWIIIPFIIIIDKILIASILLMTNEKKNLKI